MANKEKNKALEKQRKLEEDRYYEEKLAHERKILQERYDQERQREIQLKAKAFKMQEPAPPVAPGDSTPGGSKKGILKSKSDAKLKTNGKGQRSIRFEDEVPIEELKNSEPESLTPNETSLNGNNSPAGENVSTLGMDSIEENNKGFFDSQLDSLNNSGSENNLQYNQPPYNMPPYNQHGNYGEQGGQSFKDFSFGPNAQQQYQQYYLQNQQPLDSNHPMMQKYNRNPLDNEKNLLPFIPTAKEILHQQSMRDVRAEIMHLRGNILESQQKLRSELESIRSDVIKSTMKKNYAHGLYNQYKTNKIGGVWSNYGAGKSSMDGQDNFYKKIDVGTVGYGENKWQIPVIDFEKVYGQMNRKFEELRNPNYIEKKEGDILDKIYGEQDASGQYKTEPLGGLRFDPQSAAFINIKSKYLDEVMAEDRDRELNSENQFLDINNPSNNEVGGLKVVNESVELQTDSKMLNGNGSGFLGIEKTDQSKLMNPSSLDSSKVNESKPAYNHSVYTSKDRQSIQMINLDGSDSKQPDTKNKKAPSLPKINEIHTLDNKNKESGLGTARQDSSDFIEDPELFKVDEKSNSFLQKSMSERITESNFNQNDFSEKLSSQSESLAGGYIPGDVIANKQNQSMANSSQRDQSLSNGTSGYQIGESLGGVETISQSSNVHIEDEEDDF